MVAAPTRDYFDRARAWAVAVMLAAGAAAVIGSMLEWVTITVRPELQPGTRFDATEALEEPEVSEPYTGLEARDGWWSLAGGVVLVIAGIALSVRRRAAWGWLGLLGAVTIGAVAIADYRGIGDLSSSISHRLDVVGGAEPGVGLTLVVAAGIAGLIGSVAGIAASPHR
jgi:LPXTG-motif cell wall-anchored protein